ncbi:hypothetical protein BDP27DRAFT_1422925 [Rhodocollybia butyracea]|uniref:Uncharacterized protein n=1 Tax=Rhodocollybia butyracea TaxID=206335 RepID=A0A9P5U644_9AGAR|nr:hypothetical protein BDP27DRAFT_1422925 [Rhodocollybia butyracea]
MAEGPVNLNWDPIMKHINESPYEFFQGSWTFLCSTTQGVEIYHCITEHASGMRQSIHISAKNLRDQYNAIWESIDRIRVNSPAYFDFLEKKTYERMRAPSHSLLSVQTFDYDALSSFAESEEKKDEEKKKEAAEKKEAKKKKERKKKEEAKKPAKKPVKKNEETKKATKPPKKKEGAKKPAKPAKKREEEEKPTKGEEKPTKGEEKPTKRKPEARIPEIASKKARTRMR